MKLSGTEANRYFARPDPASAGLLVHGADPIRVAMKRQQVIAALIGPDGPAEMRLTRIAAAELRRDPALVQDAVKAQGFFPGVRAVLIEDAGDGVTEVIGAALKAWQAGDASIIVTAGLLPGKSTLRKLFETHPRVFAAGLYDDPPTRAEIEAELLRAGLKAFEPGAMTDLTALSQALEPGDFRQMLEKIALYKWGDDSALTSSDLIACAPATIEAEVDDVLDCVAEQRAGDVGRLMRRLEGQGINPVTLCIGTLRHFRTLHAAACDPGGPASGLARMRPPVFGPRRDRLIRQAQAWGVRRLEEALTLIVETDLALRSTSRAPAMAVMERALIRLAMMRRSSR